MNTNKIRQSPAGTNENSYIVWNDLAAKTTKRMTTSAQVIRHRSIRMALAGPLPNQRSQAEFSLMGKEKIEAMSIIRAGNDATD
ncbi:MAG: hypothetical protein H7240_01895, partial [Glaciimonas sp.]|nr:hypothetical protein [Glaciimonas sp.]